MFFFSSRRRHTRWARDWSSDVCSSDLITVKADIPGEPHTHLRQYSLSCAPNQGAYRISVKREEAIGDNPAGIVSNFLHEDRKSTRLNSSHVASSYAGFCLKEQKASRVA